MPHLNSRYFPVENPALRNGHTEDESRALHMGVCFTRFSQVKQTNHCEVLQKNSTDILYYTIVNTL